MFLQALNEFYRGAVEPDAAERSLILEPAFAKRYVRWIIPINSDGDPEGYGLIEVPKPKAGGKLLIVPKSNRPKVSGRVAEFLWENLESVFGLAAESPGAGKSNSRNRRARRINRDAKFIDFWSRIKRAEEATDSLPIRAVLRFYDKYVSGGPPEFLRRRHPDGERKNSHWLVKTADGTEKKLGADKFTFQVNGALLIGDKQVMDFWRATFDEERLARESESKKGACLITGQKDVAVSPSHLPKIRGVPETITAGASLISSGIANSAFSSYGWEGSYNAPVSFAAVEGYTNALNFLLSDQNHSLLIDKTVFVFWAGNTDVEWFANLLKNPDRKTLEEFGETMIGDGCGRPSPDGDEFYALVLSGQAGRIFVRRAIRIKTGEVRTNLKKWFADLNIMRIDSPENDKLPAFSLFRLATATVRNKKDLPPETAAHLFSAALLGTAPPVTIIDNLVEHIAEGLSRDGLSGLLALSRFALLKLAVNRNEPDPEKMIPPNLADIADVPYNCGRLLAIFAETQAAAYDYKLKGGGIIEKYFAAAAATPGLVFDNLWRLHRHHLKKIMPKDLIKFKVITKKFYQLAKNFERRSFSDMQIPLRLPRSLIFRERGRFALGFYHQCAAESAGRRSINRKAVGEPTEKNIN